MERFPNWAYGISGLTPKELADKSLEELLEIMDESDTLLPDVMADVAWRLNVDWDAYEGFDEVAERLDARLQELGYDGSRISV